jgi:hypothetical protein
MLTVVPIGPTDDLPDIVIERHQREHAMDHKIPIVTVPFKAVEPTGILKVKRML